MCGIYFLMTPEAKTDALICRFFDKFSMLQHRGYDSAGVCTISSSVSYVDKVLRPTSFALSDTPIDMLMKTSLQGSNRHTQSSKGVQRMYLSHHPQNKNTATPTIMMGHTRWATHGRIAIENTHPFVSYNRRYVLTHNGVITNYLAILRFLQNVLPDSQESFYHGQTDSEILVHLIAFGMENPDKLDALPDVHTPQETNTVLDSILAKVGGIYSIVVADALLHHVYLARRSNPLVLQIYENELYVSSETGSLPNFDSQSLFWEVPENVAVEIICDDPKRDRNSPYQFMHAGSGVRIQPEWTALTGVCTTATGAILPTEEGITDYYTVIEIIQQTDLWLKYFHRKQQQQHPNLEKHDPSGLYHLLFVGCGSSYYAGLFASKWIRRFTRNDGLRNVIVQCYQAFDFEMTHPVDNNSKKDDDKKSGQSLYTTICFLSQSGETFDVLRCARNILLDDHQTDNNNSRIKSLAVTNVRTSSLTRVVKDCLYIDAGIERGVAATKSFSMQALALLSYWGVQECFKGTNPEILRSEIEGIHRQWLNRHQNHMHNWVRKLCNFQSVFILCRNIAVALEGSLKMKELAYIHAEGYHMGSLKHGPFAMLDGKTAGVIMICTDTSREEEDWSVYQEVNARDTLVFCIVTSDHEIFRQNVANDELILISNDSIQEIFMELLAVVHLQWLACQMAIHRGFHPDYPRNLAKTVTVL